MSRKSRAARREERPGQSRDLLQELEVGLFVKRIMGHVLEEPPREREAMGRLKAGARSRQSQVARRPHIGLEAPLPCHVWEPLGRRKLGESKSLIPRKPGKP